MLLAAVLTAPILMARAQTADDKAAEEKAALCSACHGAAGVPTDKTIPIIWGQMQGYIYLELRDFKSGARQNDVMSAVAGQLSRDDMMALAAYFAGKRWPSVRQEAASDADAKTAKADIGSIGCPACHSDQFQGDGTVPRAAGQNAAYLAKTMQDFRTGARANNPGMTSLMKATPEQDFPALVRYLAGLSIN